MKDSPACYQSLRPGSVNSSVFTLCSSIIGAGALSLPYAFVKCGIGGGILLTLICSTAYYTFYYITIYAMSEAGVTNYIRASTELYGQLLRRISEIAMFSMCFGTMCSYIVLVAKFIGEVLIQIGIYPTGEFWRIILIVGFLIVIWIPMSIPTKLTNLRYFSMLSTLGIAYITIVVIIGAPSYVPDSGYGIGNFSDFIVSRGALDALGILFFAFNGAPIVAFVYEELRERTLDRINAVLLRSYGMLTIFYLVLAIVGAISYGGGITELVVDRPGSGMDWLMLVGKLMVGIYLMVGTIILLSPSRTAVLNFLYHDGFYPNPQQHNITNVILLVAACSIAIFVPDILKYFKVIGGVFCVFYSFTLPALYYLQVKGNGCLKILVLIIGIVFTIIGAGVALDVFF